MKYIGPLKGRGVFATQDIKKNEIIEVCPVVTLCKRDLAAICEEILHNYGKNWADDRGWMVKDGIFTEKPKTSRQKHSASP